MDETPSLKKIMIDKEYVPILPKLYSSMEDGVYDKGPRVSYEQERYGRYPERGMMIERGPMIETIHREYRPENTMVEISRAEYKPQFGYRGPMIETSRNEYMSPIVSRQSPMVAHRSPMMEIREYLSPMISHRSPMIEPRSVYPSQRDYQQREQQNPYYPKSQPINEVYAWSSSDSYQRPRPSEVYRPPTSNREYLRPESHRPSEFYQRRSDDNTFQGPPSMDSYQRQGDTYSRPPGLEAPQRRTEVSIYPREERYPDFYRPPPGQRK